MVQIGLAQLVSTRRGHHSLLANYLKRKHHYGSHDRETESILHQVVLAAILVTVIAYR